MDVNLHGKRSRAKLKIKRVHLLLQLKDQPQQGQYKVVVSKVPKAKI